MAISDIFTVQSGSVAVTSTSATPVLLIKGSATARLWVVGVRVGIGVTAAAAGNSLLFQLCRTNNTPVGTTTVTASPKDPSAPAFLGTCYTAWSTAPTVASPPVCTWEQELPQTTGSAWEEYPPLGYEHQIPVNSGSTGWMVMMVTASVATSTPVLIDLDISQ